MARVGLARLEYLLERVDRALDMEASDVTVNTLTSDLGVTVTAGGLLVTAGGLQITAGNLKVHAGRLLEVYTVSDVNTQNHTLTGTNTANGIVVYTSNTGGGDLTIAAASIIAGHVATGRGALLTNGEAITCHIINDGDQTITLVAGSGTTLADAGNTIAANESTTLLLRRDSGSAITVYSLS
tara:strand:+ start:159 stop:707 length:549 start_codon:yes stop_codon:yes gene_type:complete